MPGRNYFLVTALPSLGELGTPPPMGLTDFLAHLDDATAPRRQAEVLFLADDLRQRESILAGETDQVEPVVLSAEQVRDEQPLPDFLAAEANDTAARLPADLTWEKYFRHAADVARRTGGALLAAWVGHEVALRNALAAARARTLELDAAGYLVATDLAEPDAAFGPVINDWTAADNPLEGLKVLDRARWAWLTAHGRYFSFADDELVAYAAKLLLLNRWQRLQQAVPEAADAPNVSATRQRIAT